VLNVKPAKRPRRGAAAQQRKRELERSVRVSVLAFAHWAECQGYSQRDAAAMLGLKAGTLASWERGWREDRLYVESLGRPARDSDWETRQLIIGLFYLVGPGIGLPCLRAFFPDAAKSELEDMLRRYRQIHLKRHKVLLHVLRWQKPGAVWAMDFEQPPAPVDGIYPYVFLVRDLASGNQLLSLPVPSRELRHVIGALVALFQRYGPPLVLKSDNEFNADKVAANLDDELRSSLQKLAALLAEHGVIQLLSPPAWPRYNAAIEAGIGSFATRAHHEAARHGHPGEWNCDDVEAARLQANELARPWGHNADTPDITWQQRRPIDAEDRAAFIESVQQLEQEARQERQKDLLPETPLGPRDMASARREAISRALVQHGLLLFRRRRFTLPLKRVVWSNIP
jgi:hypothetical protein